jgi:hypothetical protein
MSRVLRILVGVVFASSAFAAELPQKCKKRMRCPVLVMSPPPPDATALCCDNWWSQTVNRQAACSHHCGVKRWLKTP